MAEFEIKVTELEAGGKQRDYVLTPAWLDNALAEVAVEGATPLRADPSKANGEVSVYAEKSGEDVIVRGHVTANLLAECSRCLGDAPLSVRANITALFTSRADTLRVPVGEDEELAADEPDTELFSGDTVVLDGLVREHVLLEVPMQTLCSEACEGLQVPDEIRGPADLANAPTHEGKRIDPRLAPLLELMDKTKKGSS